MKYLINMGGNQSNNRYCCKESNFYNDIAMEEIKIKSNYKTKINKSFFMSSVGIFGSSDAGKTTLTNILCGKSFNENKIKLENNVISIPLNVLNPDFGNLPFLVKFFDIYTNENKNNLWDIYSCKMNLIIYLIDASTNLNKNTIINDLKNIKTKMKISRILLVANKIDKVLNRYRSDVDNILNEVYKELWPSLMGIQIISCSQGLNIDDIKNKIAHLVYDSAQKINIPVNPVVNILIIGQNCVGKTTLFNCAFSDEKINKIYPVTLSYDLHVLNMDINGKSIQIRLCDTMSLNGFQKIINNLYKNFDIILFVYDAEEFIKKYEYDIQYEKEITSKFPNKICYRVFMKSDLINNNYELENLDIFFSRNNPQKIQEFIKQKVNDLFYFYNK